MIPARIVPLIRFGLLAAAASVMLTSAISLPALADGLTRATPPPTFQFSGFARAFYFGRTNGDTCLTCKTKGSPDATAFNFGGRLKAQFNIGRSPWSLAGSYFGAHPFGANSPGPMGNIGYNPQIDNTVPGYPISVWGEIYLQYKSNGTFMQTGKEVLSSAQSPWAPASDTRIEPSSYQGTLLSSNLTPDLSVGAMYMARFKSRVSSAFNANTLLTSCDTAFPTGKGPVPGIKGTFTVPGDVCNKQQKSSGFSQGSLSYIFGDSGLSAGINQYEIYSIASMTWVTAQYNISKKSRLNPYLSGHYLAENNLGSSLIGTVHNYTAGGLIGVTLNHSLNFTVGYDESPSTAYVVPSKSCSGTAASPTAASPGAIFGGVPDTSNKNVPKGDVVCYGGGLASPYTDGYTSDPLYTTSLTQGLVEVHKPGTGVKAVLTWLSTDRRLKLIASNGWYNYALPGSSGKASNGDSRTEFDFDVQYWFSGVHPSGIYRGLSIRQRYGDRIQPFAPFEFKSSRTQLEYTF